ncbi:MAG: DUF2087 domain-containing protein [Candidatus Peregrinibacteria bacterium]|nr:DUF2087 domain-containing protein [Candidatus Peregrinibacteria bacterium]
MEKNELSNHLNEAGQLTNWPAKPKRKLLALQYLAEKFPWEKRLTEREVNELLNQHHTFEDPALLRRELFMKGYLDRKLDGSAYWRTSPESATR